MNIKNFFKISGAKIIITILLFFIDIFLGMAFMDVISPTGFLLVLELITKFGIIHDKLMPGKMGYIHIVKQIGLNGNKINTFHTIMQH